MIVEIADADDERLADYVRLREASLRRSLEAEHGLFIAEGEKVIHRAIGAGYRPRSFLLPPRWLAGLEQVLARYPDAPVYVVSEELAEQVTGFHVHRGALASLHREDRFDLTAILQADRLVVLEDVVDHTNVGAILRNAAGLGWDGALLSSGAADPLYRRSIKVSMGAVFSLPWARLPDRPSAPDLLREHGFTTLALTPDPAAMDLTAFAADLARHPRRLAVLLGSEGPGLSPVWRSVADVEVRIPMYGGIDSLNVAATSAIVCHALGPWPGTRLQSSSSLAETGQSSG